MSPLDLISITNVKVIMPVIYYSVLPGSIGGMATFVLGLRKGHYKNNKYIAKFLVETTGAALTAPFIVNFIEDHIFRSSFAFCIGVGWSSILQTVRIIISRFIEAAIDEKISGANK